MIPWDRLSAFPVYAEDVGSAKELKGINAKKIIWKKDGSKMIRIPYTHPDDEKKYDTRLRHSFPIPTKKFETRIWNRSGTGNQAGINNQLVPFFLSYLRNKHVLPQLGSSTSVSSVISRGLAD